jgi:Cd2+/Zn2+-exporting ATPase
VLVRASRKAEDSTLQRISRLVEDAQATKAPAKRLIDRFSRVYTPIVLSGALLLTAVPPLFGAPFETWFYRALALLIIACPCALVISTPVTVVSSIGAASRRGILIKGGAILEATGRLTALAFDKTGTLTEGRPVLARVVLLGDTNETEALVLAAALERRSEHPLAHAILAAVAENKIPEVTSFRSISGRGAEGVLSGRAYLIGSPSLFAERNVSLEAARTALVEVEAAGETPVVLGHLKGPLAVFGLADAPRPEAKTAIESLRDAGVADFIMLTGDAEAPACRVAEALNIRYEARLLPEEKVRAIHNLGTGHSAVGMVGDGTNDAPALATA